MGGIFGVASKSSCTLDLFFGTDYHSHLGTRRGGMAVYGKNGFSRSIHNIENTPFRTKFDRDLDELEGTLGIGCISDNEPQPLLVQSHLGSFAITTVGKINNMDELVDISYKNGCTHFLEMSGGSINPTEMVASLINQKSSLVEGIQYDPSYLIKYLPVSFFYIVSMAVGYAGLRFLELSVSATASASSSLINTLAEGSRCSLKSSLASTSAC